MGSRDETKVGCDAGDIVARRQGGRPEIGVPNSKLIEGVSGGWSMVFASPKSLLETGESLEASRKWPAGM